MPETPAQRSLIDTCRITEKTEQFVKTNRGEVKVPADEKIFVRRYIRTPAGEYQVTTGEQIYEKTKKTLINRRGEDVPIPPHHDEEKCIKELIRVEKALPTITDASVSRFIEALSLRDENAKEYRYDDNPLVNKLNGVTKSFKIDMSQYASEDDFYTPDVVQAYMRNYIMEMTGNNETKVVFERETPGKKERGNAYWFKNDEAYDKWKADPANKENQRLRHKVNIAEILSRHNPIPKKEGQKPRLDPIAVKVGVSESDWAEIVKAQTTLSPIGVTDMHITISSDILDLLMKTEGQGWKSCESLGGDYCDGPYSDIRNFNGIAIVRLGDSKKWSGRMSLRWCVDEDSKKDVGVEWDVYGVDKYRHQVRKNVRQMLKDEGFLDYTHCKTPYEYSGYSDYKTKVLGQSATGQIDFQYTEGEKKLDEIYDEYDHAGVCERKDESHYEHKFFKGNLLWLINSKGMDRETVYPTYVKKDSTFEKLAKCAEVSEKEYEQWKLLPELLKSIRSKVKNQPFLVGPFGPFGAYDTTDVPTRILTSSSRWDTSSSSAFSYDTQDKSWKNGWRKIYDAAKQMADTPGEEGLDLFAKGVTERSDAKMYPLTPENIDALDENTFNFVCYQLLGENWLNDFRRGDNELRTKLYGAFPYQKVGHLNVDYFEYARDEKQWEYLVNKCRYKPPPPPPPPSPVRVPTGPSSWGKRPGETEEDWVERISGTMPVSKFEDILNRVSSAERYIPRIDEMYAMTSDERESIWGVMTPEQYHQYASQPVVIPTTPSTAPTSSAREWYPRPGEDRDAWERRLQDTLTDDEVEALIVSIHSGGRLPTSADLYRATPAQWARLSGAMDEAHRYARWAAFASASNPMNIPEPLRRRPDESRNDYESRMWREHGTTDSEVEGFIQQFRRGIIPNYIEWLQISIGQLVRIRDAIPPEMMALWEQVVAVGREE